MSETKQKNSLQTVSDLMLQMQEEIVETKSGVIDQPTARIVAKMRKTQCDLIGMQIQAARLVQKNKTATSLNPEMRIVSSKAEAPETPE